MLLLLSAAGSCLLSGVLQGTQPHSFWFQGQNSPAVAAHCVSVANRPSAVKQQAGVLQLPTWEPSCCPALVSGQLILCNAPAVPVHEHHWMGGMGVHHHSTEDGRGNICS